MTHLLAFLGLSAAVLAGLLVIQAKSKKIKPSAILGLFAFGIVLSVPFVLVEHMAFHLKYYLVVLSFIGIEALVIMLEHKWKYLHDLIHHNIKDLRILGFILIGLGFAYSELTFYLLESSKPIAEVVTVLPIKGLFAIFIHSTLTASGVLITATETLVEHAFLFFLYYMRLVFISISHYLYLFFIEHKAGLLLLVFIGINTYLFVRHTKYLDKKAEVLINT